MVVQRARAGHLKGNAIHDVKLILSMALLSLVIRFTTRSNSILPLYDRLTAVLEQLQRALRNPVCGRRLG